MSTCRNGCAVARHNAIRLGSHRQCNGGQGCQRKQRRESPRGHGQPPCLMAHTDNISRPLNRQHFQTRERRVGRTPATRHGWDKARNRCAGMPVEGAQIDGPELPARRAGEREPRQPGRDGGTDSRVEPQRAAAGLARVPNSDDLLRVGDCLALGLGAPCLSRRPRCGALSFLCSAVRVHDERLPRTHPTRRFIQSPRRRGRATAAGFRGRASSRS
jgi:hypothetical protein